MSIRPSVRSRLLLGAALAALAAPGLSQAEDAPTRVSELIVTGEAGEVTVATKTDTPLLETPQAISVISGETLRERGVMSIQDALLYSAGVRSDAYGNDGRVDSYFVRGVAPAQYLDGMRSTYAYYDTAKVDPYALSSVEIMRGPASVLFGDGAIGGLLNLVRKSPQRQARTEDGGRHHARHRSHHTGLLMGEGYRQHPWRNRGRTAPRR